MVGDGGRPIAERHLPPISFLWDLEEGLVQLDKFLYTAEDHIKAGAVLGIGELLGGWGGWGGGRVWGRGGGLGRGGGGGGVVLGHW